MSLTRDQLAALDEVREVTIHTSVGDRSIGTTIWVVVFDGSIFVRSVRADAGAWYRRALTNTDVALEFEGQRVSFHAVPVESSDTIAAVSEALRSKYPPGGSLDRMTRPEVLAHTLRLDPTH